MAGVHGKHYEELQVGDKYVTMGRTVTETDIVNFVTLGGFFEELFINHEYVEKETQFKGIIAPGALTFTFAEGLVIQSGLLHRTGMAFLGMTLKVLAPTRVNDTLHVEVEVTEKRTTSQPGRGIVTFTHTVMNQHGQPVLVYSPVRMIKGLEG